MITVFIVSTKFFPAFRKRRKNILAKLPEQDEDSIKILNEHTAIKDLEKKLSESSANKNQFLSEFADNLEAHIRFGKEYFLQNSKPPFGLAALVRIKELLPMFFISSEDQRMFRSVTKTFCKDTCRGKRYLAKYSAFGEAFAEVKKLLQF